MAKPKSAGVDDLGPYLHLADDVVILGARLAGKKEEKPVKTYKLPEELRTKQASLDQSLGFLYQEFGPTMQKHAAAQFYSRLDKARLDEEALGAPFCKLASASGLDPWKMALQVVQGYPNLVKMASGQPSQAQELAAFYVAWGDEMEKRAKFLSMGMPTFRRAGEALVGGAKKVLGLEAPKALEGVTKSVGSMVPVRGSNMVTNPQQALKQNLIAKREAAGLQSGKPAALPQSVVEGQAARSQAAAANQPLPKSQTIPKAQRKQMAQAETERRQPTRMATQQELQATRNPQPAAQPAAQPSAPTQPPKVTKYDKPGQQPAAQQPAAPAQQAAPPTQPAQQQPAPTQQAPAPTQPAPQPGAAREPAGFENAGAPAGTQPAAGTPQQPAAPTPEGTPPPAPGAEKSPWGGYMMGAGALGALGLGAGSMMGGEAQPQVPNYGYYPQ